MIEFECPGCQAKYKVGDELAGRKAKCKKCQTLMSIPEPIIEAEVLEDELLEAMVVNDDSAQQAYAGQPYGDQAYPAQAYAPQPAMSPQAARAQAATQTSNQVVRGQSPNFGFEISQRPDFALVTLRMQQGQKVFSEPSAMAAMTPTITLKAGFKGGLGKTLGRAFGGESLIINTLEATSGPGEASFAPGVSGDIAHYSLNNNSLYLQRGAFLLHSEGVDVTGKWQGAKGFFSGQGLVLLKASGVGDVFFNSYGAILAVDVAGQYYVDTGYIVAFEDTLQYRVTTVPGLRPGGNLKSFFFGGEGLVCQFAGQGRVWIQTRHPQSFLSWINPYRPVKRD